MLTGRLGPYTLIRQIAIGGMAEIYLAVVAEGDEPHRQFAIKVIHQQNADDPDFVRMLVDEARLAVQLKHPNIVTTYDLGRENEQYYIVMELVEGADLFRLQQRAADQRLSLPIPLAAYIAREVARGLDYAHRLRDSEGHALQVVHRDISPQNVLLSFDGAVKITDFGIAKAARRSAQTQAGIIKGKYYYMSPEQATGQAIDGRTDIFAAGILLYEMLIGEMLYYDENVDRLLEVVRKADIPPVSQRRTDTPPTLERVLMRALSKSPGDRYQTAAEYGDALDTYLRRYAPRFGAADVAAFLEKLVGEKVRRRALHEHTAALSVSAAAMRQQAAATPEKTAALPIEEISQNGVRDENSLIFNPKAQLAALMGGSSISSPEPGSGRQSDDSLLQTRQHTLGSSPSRRGSSSGTIEVAVPSLRSADSSSGITVVKSSPKKAAEALAEAGGAVLNVPRHTLRTHAIVPPPSPPAEVFRAIEPEFEEELLAGAAALAPQPHALTGSRRIPTFPRHHLPLAEQLASSEVTVPRAEVPPELLAALMQRQEEHHTRPERAAPRPAPSHEPSAKVELLQSDLAFSDPSTISVEPSVELAQDANFSDPKLAPSDRQPGPHPPVDGGAASLDAFSSESTHSNLAPAERRPELEPAATPAPPSPMSTGEAAIQPPTPARLWPYWVSGLGAALLSAGLTWYLTGPGAHRPDGDAGKSADLLAANHLATALILPDTPRPEAEPPPAGEAPPTASAAHASQHNQEASDATGQLVINSKPEGADVYLNKKRVGQTPLTLRDLPTDKDLKAELRLTGYPKVRKHIKWRGKTSLEVLILLPAPGASEPAAGDDGSDSKSGAKSDAKSGGDKGESGAPAGGEN